MKVTTTSSTPLPEVEVPVLRELRPRHQVEFERALQELFGAGDRSPACGGSIGSAQGRARCTGVRNPAGVRQQTSNAVTNTTYSLDGKKPSLLWS